MYLLEWIIARVRRNIRIRAREGEGSRVRVHAPSRCPLLGLCDRNNEDLPRRGGTNKEPFGYWDGSVKSWLRYFFFPFSFLFGVV